MIKEFSAALYEPRWHEVLKFLRILLPRLKTLAATFDVAKFKSGVDFSGASRQDQQRVQDRQEDQAGLTKFAPEAVAKALRDPVFFHFVHLCFALERMPNKLAKFGESCPCHGVLQAHLSKHAAEQLMEGHYGKGIASCPAAGMVAPELVAGVIDSHFEDSLSDLETELLDVNPLPNADPMGASHWAMLTGNCRAGHKHLMSLFMLKLVFWQQLPWMLCGLAIGDEVRAKEIGRKAIQLFSEDPRREVHHRITWFWLHPGGLLRYQLDMYVSTDMSRDQVGQPFCRMVAALRFVIVVETTIEEKHAKVTAARRRHCIGPVRVSLANRLPMLERWIHRGHMTADELLACFDRMRSLNSIVKEFSFELSPELAQRKSGAVQLSSRSLRDPHTVCTSIFYGCSIESMYRSLRGAADSDRKAKDKQRRREAAAPEPVCWASVNGRALIDHFAEVLDSNSFYSCPAHALSLETLGNILEQPASKRARLNSDVALRPEFDLLDPESLEDDPLRGNPQDVIFFQPIFAHAGRKKVVRTSAGAGGRLKQNQILVSVHKPLVGFGSETVLNNRAAAAAGSKMPVYVLSRFTADDVIQTCMIYKSGCQHWTIPGLELRPGIEDMELCLLIRSFMTTGAYPGGRLDADGVALFGMAEACAQDLQVIGHCEVVAGRWRLTMQGQQALRTCSLVERPTPLFQLRDDLAIEDMSLFELQLSLANAGWQWREWLPPSKRKRVDALIPAAYAPGDAKIWYSTLDVLKVYLIALLRAEDA